MDDIRGALNRYPTGLLELINSKVGGITPSLLSQTAVGQLDLLPFLQAGTGLITEGATGVTSLVPGGITTLAGPVTATYPIMPLSAVFQIDTTAGSAQTVQFLTVNASGNPIACRDLPPFACAIGGVYMSGLNFERGTVWTGGERLAVQSTTGPGVANVIGTWLTYAPIARQ